MAEHELFWKEAIVLALILIFGTTTMYNPNSESLHWGFIFLGLIFYWLTSWEEQKIKMSKKMHTYFQHTSSYFLLATIFFVIGFIVFKNYGTGLPALFASIGIILFSVGFMRLIFAKIK